MQRHKYQRALCGAVLITVLSGCASNTDSDSERRLLPSYATPVGVLGGWTVRCPLQAISGPDDRDTSMFYKSDGSAKTLDEFCSEYDAASRIPGNR